MKVVYAINIVLICTLLPFYVKTSLLDFQSPVFISLITMWWYFFTWKVTSFIKTRCSYYRWPFPEQSWVKNLFWSHSFVQFAKRSVMLSKSILTVGFESQFYCILFLFQGSGPRVLMVQTLILLIAQTKRISWWLGMTLVMSTCSGFPVWTRRYFNLCKWRF